MYEFRVGDQTFHLRVRDGAVEPRAGEAGEPDLKLAMEAQTLRELFDGTLDPAQAVAGGRVTFEGEPAALQNALAILAG